MTKYPCREPPVLPPTPSGRREENAKTHISESNPKLMKSHPRGSVKITKLYSGKANKIPWQSINPYIIKPEMQCFVCSI